VSGPIDDGDEDRGPVVAVGADGWWPAAMRYESPNFDSRPDPADISLLVIHNISLPGGCFGGPHVSDLFTCRLDYNVDPSLADLRGLKVSSHFFIRRDGRVIQYVSANDRAWHAGRSAFRGREKCNDYSIGIELEGTDDMPFEAPQYQVLAALTEALRRRYPLTDVQGHEDIAPGRKTDPGPLFDWQVYVKNWQTFCEGTPIAGQRLVVATAVLRFVKGLP
jgi:AmpD protein